jgi:hypothetical protein
MSRLKRIRKAVDGGRLQKRRATLPPAAQLRAEAKILRESGDPKAVAVANAFLAVDEMLFPDGCTVREGGPKPRRWPLHEAWRGKEPPERP